MSENNIQKNEGLPFDSRIIESDIRIVTFNLANYISPERRVDKFFKLMEMFDADILMFQEAFSMTPPSEIMKQHNMRFYNWHEYIDETLEKMGYALVPTNHSEISSNVYCNPIYYRSSKIELTDSSLHIFPSSGATFTVADLKRVSDKKPFTCICSHFSVDAGERDDDGVVFAEFLTEYQKAHNNAPTFLLGDLNSLKSNLPAPITEIMTHALDMEGLVPKNLGFGTSCNIAGVWPGNWLRKDECLIDHALGVGEGYRGKQFQIIATEMAAATSDHIPVLFDFELT
jgi:endonuclease/exonuclease/phosphatase family metal-dependent hydrolase